MIDHSLVPLHSLPLDVPVLLPRPLLLLEPLPRNVGVSSQAPVVVVVADEYVDVPADKHENQVYEATVDLVRCLHTHQFHTGEEIIEARIEVSWVLL